ncbi:uncharacterized protein Z519_05444 [Cladophialophora bantiana CBS 173.52]|uniref:FAD/NAD(P)-binding domain-containing protein n=1 Tax=Cladophialophora bantiana (strain ATCC 10958 / CBS 173.52 / CDC B-1940 / NIH 8579) TaxID=1442370 RepID=A0A0D2HLG1_CLAB1|nr:uncharacterized protein Z519_05444 [Cladophialophora bantiana CBS 173.52]KIW94128.1 hypothetical protein Z519_05444 [Cladophialophora bantiana CBS 173.52]
MSPSQEGPILVEAPPSLSLKPQSLDHDRAKVKNATQHENEWYRSHFSSNGYAIQEQPLHTQWPMRVLIVRARAAGLQIAYKALKQLSNVTFTIYEKNADVGGTWLENRYPGCTCDIPSHSYQFSFWRKPDWKSHYAGADEIRQYLRSFALENDLERHVNFGHRVEEARSWKCRDIPGVELFPGKVMHSAAWDDGVELEVLNNTPSLSRIKAMADLHLFRADSEEQKAAFASDEKALDKYCRDVEGELNKGFTLMHLDSIDQTTSREFAAKTMLQKLGGDPRQSCHLIPKYALGCRRMTPGTDYPQSLSKPNVDVVTDSAIEVTGNGMLDSSGKHMEVDIVIFATGLDTSFSLPYTVLGENSRNLRQKWGSFPKGYLSIIAEGFPNMFHFIGPNGPASHRSILPILEWHTRYMFKVISHTQRTSIKSLGPSSAAVKELYVHTHEPLKRTAWSSACRSWFKNGKLHGPVTAIWPGSRLHYFEMLSELRYEDFDILYLGNGNRFAHLGNGYTEAELDENSNAMWYFDVLEKELELKTKAFEPVEF